MQELIHQFGIDWRLVLAQAVNFGILFFVLWRFAYRPVLGMLETRREKIREGISMREEAEKKLKEAGAEKEALLNAAEKESLSIVARGEAVGKKKEAEVVAEAFKKSEGLIRDGKQRAEEEKRIAAESFSKEAAELVRHAVAKVIERSPETVDDQLVHKALQELQHIK